MRAKNNQLSHLRDVLLGQEKPGQRELFPIRFPWLNRSQEEAVNKVLGAKQVSIVHGPPGTGKTTTLVEAIYETLHRENQVIVCAQSNTAVDCISEKLVDRGINVLRIGNPLVSMTRCSLSHMNAVSSRIRIIPNYGASGKRYGIYNPICERKAGRNGIRSETASPV